jgi:hypothetical protein
MSQPNQPQNQQQSKPEPKVPGPDDRIKVKVIAGKLLIAHGNADDNDDIFANVGETVEVPRKFWEKHQKSRQFDSYCLPNGGIADRPSFVNDATLQLVEDPIETHNKSISKAA